MSMKETMEPSAERTALRSKERREFLRTAGAWAACTAVAWIHVGIIMNAVYPAGISLWAVPLSLLAPGIITTVLLRSWRRWYRWAAIGALAFSTFPDVLPAVLLVAETWALHRAWVIERTVPLNSLFRSAKRSADTDSKTVETVKTAPPAKKKGRAASA